MANCATVRELCKRFCTVRHEREERGGSMRGRTEFDAVLVSGPPGAGVGVRRMRGPGLPTNCATVQLCRARTVLAQFVGLGRKRAPAGTNCGSPSFFLPRAAKCAKFAVQVGECLGDKVPSPLLGVHFTQFRKNPSIRSQVPKFLTVQIKNIYRGCTVAQFLMSSDLGGFQARNGGSRNCAGGAVKIGPKCTPAQFLMSRSAAVPA